MAQPASKMDMEIGTPITQAGIAAPTTQVEDVDEVEEAALTRRKDAPQQRETGEEDDGLFQDIHASSN